MADAPEKPLVNVADIAFRDNGDGKHFAAKLGRIGPALGLTKLGCTVTGVPPGKRAFPFHRHHVIEEMFYVLSGSGEYRHGKERLAVRAGDIVAAPAGGKAHQFVNTGAEDLRYLAVSTMGSVDIVEYPDSGKVAMAAGIKDADFRTATYVGMGHVQPAGYWEGEGEK